MEDLDVFNIFMLLYVFLSCYILGRVYPGFICGHEREEVHPFPVVLGF